MKLLITGANGQLGNEMRKISAQYADYEFIFTDVAELDICNERAVADLFEGEQFDLVINCAAYTAVDKAEEDVELCYKINHDALENIGRAAATNGTKVIHVSTDYVFDGSGNIPYTEEMAVCPATVYGKSKLAGEQALTAHCEQSVILRTAWLYSSFGNNFVKTMLKFGKERDSLNVIFDQIGTPTYAADLAVAIMKIVSAENFVAGIYHFSNEGVCSWYDFTKMILEFSGISCRVLPIETKDYPAKTPRPHYSVLNKTKIKRTYHLEIPYWTDSLKKCLEELKIKS